MHELTPPPALLPAMDPQSDQAGPFRASIQENEKPAVKNQPKFIYKISPPPAPLPVEDWQLDEPAGPLRLLFMRRASQSRSSSMQARRHDENLKAWKRVLFCMKISKVILLYTRTLVLITMTYGEVQHRSSRRRPERGGMKVLFAHPFLYFWSFKQFTRGYAPLFNFYSTISAWNAGSSFDYQSLWRRLIINR